MPKLINKNAFGLPELTAIVRRVTGKPKEQSLFLAIEILKIMARAVTEKDGLHFKNFCSVHIVDVKPGKMLVCGKMQQKEPRKVKARFSRNFRKEIEES